MVSLNLRAYFGPGGSQIKDLAGLIASHQPDVALLQESRPGSLEVVCSAEGLSGVYSLDVDPRLAGRLGDGCALAVRFPLQIERAWRPQPGAFEPAAVADAIAEPVPARYEVLPSALATRFSTRTLLAEVSGGERRYARSARAKFNNSPGSAPRGTARPPRRNTLAVRDEPNRPAPALGTIEASPQQSLEAAEK